jgi:Cof subfamily protein (haloacid dehalogenase superfamily)
LAKRQGVTYKLVALDVDGTIRSKEHPISDRTRRAIAQVIESGAVVTLATGRSYRSAVKQSQDVRITAPIVSFQGAHLADPATEEVFWHQPLTEALTREALDAMREWSGDVMAYYGHEVYVNKMTPWIEAYGGRNEVVINEVGDLQKVAGLEPTRLVAVGEPDEIEKLETRLQGIFDSALHVTRSLPQFCEILHPKSGKDKALEQFCKRLSIGPEQVVAFGNGYNDVHMLRWAGLGVAIGGAVPQALAAADRTGPPVEEDGVAQVLEELLAQGMFG